MMTSGRSSSRYPFTASQWQELEHQALIFKYMASGHPIPSDLILHIRRSFLLDSITTTSPALSYPPHPTIGWSCYHQMGFGRKAEDPEPGRCRRTDGKKWRCSKEAYPDSKYCERHMHRGKNRSRKPVEMSLTTAAAAPSSSSSSSQTPPLSLSSQPAETNYHLMYPYSSYRPPGALGFHPLQNTTTHFNLDNTASYSDDHKDYRYCNGVKDADEYTFFSGGSGAERGSSWEFRPLGMNSLGERKQGNALQQQQQQGSYSFSSKEGEEKQPHCFVLGADFKLEKPVKEERGAEEEAQRPLRHFFDEWPQKSKDSWMDLEDGHSKTQLSISIPMAHHDFMVSGSRYRNDD